MLVWVLSKLFCKKKTTNANTSTRRLKTEFIARIYVVIGACTGQLTHTTRTIIMTLFEQKNKHLMMFMQIGMKKMRTIYGVKRIMSRNGVYYYIRRMR